MFGSLQRNLVKDELSVFGEQALKNAQAGHAESQNNIGLYYQMISGNTESYKQQVYLFQAAHWFTKAANQNYPPAQYNLALCYVTGEGVPRNYTEAASWYLKAAHLGYAPAQNNLGLLYEGGLGVPRSLEQAIYWWQLAANKGYEPAVYCLGPYWSQIRKFQEKKARNEPSYQTNGAKKLRAHDDASDEELETLAQEQETPTETNKEQEEAKEALRQLKLQFKHKGGAQKLRELCHQFGMKYTDKDKTLIMLAQNQEIRTLLAQQRIITM